MSIQEGFGIIGLVFVTVGILMTDRKNQNLAFISGGLLLEMYSISIGNMIFITLQGIFTAAAIYNLLKIRRQKR